MPPTPTYVVKRIGDRYVTELVQAPSPAGDCAACAAGGLALTVYGFLRGGLSGLALTAMGVGMTYKGFTGRSLFGRSKGYRPARTGPGRLAPSYQNDLTGRAPQLPADDVDEAVMESFPASDPRGA